MVGHFVSYLFLINGIAKRAKVALRGLFLLPEFAYILYCMMSMSFGISLLLAEALLNVSLIHSMSSGKAKSATYVKFKCI